MATEASPPTASFTVVAPDWITDQVRAEARLAIRNPSATPQALQLELYVDSPLGRQTLSATEIVVPGGEQTLHRAWFATQGQAGANVVGYRVTGGEGLELSGQWPLTVVASPTRGVPLITAAWFDPGAVLPGVYAQRRPMNAQDVRNEIDAAHAVGVDTLIITYPEYELNGWGAFYPSAYYDQAVDFDLVGTILNQASRNGQRVFVGLGRGDDLYLTWNGFDDAGRKTAALDHVAAVAGELWDRYQDEPAFYGWYLTHEANEIGPASDAYYNDAVDLLRDFAADKPVLISPAGTPVVNSTILQSSHVDVFAYQDAVGAGYVPYVYTYDPERRLASLEQAFAGYRAAHAATEKHLWGNLENWQMDGPAYANAYAADFARVRRQLEIHQRYVDVVTSYEWFGFAEHPDSEVGMGGEAAARFYADYRDYYREVAASLKTVNFVVNSGFESAPDAVGGWAQGWTFAGAGEGQRIAPSADTPTGTATALHLLVDEPNGTPWLVQDVPVVAGAEYQFSAWAKQLADDPSGGRLAAQIWMLADEHAADILASTALLFDRDDWHYQAAPIVAPADAKIARIVLVPQDAGFGPGVGSYLIDGVALVGPARQMPGDFDGDHDVDGSDLLHWQRGQPFRIDRDQALAWAAAFGAVGGASTGAAAQPIPEPNAAILLAGALGQTVLGTRRGAGR